MSGWTKLSSTIITSSIWSEDDKTRIMWITMLALADAKGHVDGAIPGMASMARMSLEDAEKAIQKLESPDPWSRTAEAEGRRIINEPGGWRIVNHALYREKRDDKARKEYQREWDREHRPSGHRIGKSQSYSPTRSDTVRHNPTQSDTIRHSPTKNPTQSDRVRPGPTQAEAEAEEEEEKKDISLSVAPSAGEEKKVFGDFVRLSDPEYSSLVEKLGSATADRMIRELDLGIGARGYNYPSHYYAVLDWHERQARDGRRAAKTKSGVDQKCRRCGGPADFLASDNSGAKVPWCRSCQPKLYDKHVEMAT